MPEPWEADYKPPTVAEAFDESAPLPRSALAGLDYINRKDNALQAAEARVAELERVLRITRVGLVALDVLPSAVEAIEHALKGDEAK